MEIPLHKLEIPQLIYPTSVSDVRAYASYIEMRNIALRTRAWKLLEMLGIQPIIKSALIGNGGERISEPQLYMNGSDGRSENCTSPMEPIIIIERFPRDIASSMESIRVAMDELLRGIGAYTQDGEMTRMIPGIFDGSVETKCLEEGNIASFRDNAGKALDFWPSRIIDASPLDDDGKPLLEQAKKLLAQEIQSNAGKKMLEREKSRLRDFIQVAETGKQQYKGKDIVHFDVQEGVAYYSRDHDNIIRRSFKYGPLRMVQATLTARILKRVRDDAGGGAEFLSAAPPNTAKKIAMLRSEGVLRMDPLSTDRMTELYVYFLQLYHLSEYHAVLQNEGTVQIPNPKEAKENMQELCSLVHTARAS